jgi:hypothetical protein
MCERGLLPVDDLRTGHSFKINKILANRKYSTAHIENMIEHPEN